MNDWLILPGLALAAGVLALVPMGRAVLDRGVVFIDLAVAQAAAAAALWSMGMMGHEVDWASDLAGLMGAIVCAALVAVISRRWPEQREALIGLLYVLAACLAMLGARQDPHGRERMLELLAADVLWARPTAVALLCATALTLALLLHWRPQLLMRDAWFYGAFALVVSVSVPVLGLFVVFALLIGPALWLRHRAGTGIAAALFVGWIGSAAGLALSWWADLPSGPCVALCCAASGLGALLRPGAAGLSPKP
jgi:zinc/manganese transport system permease protein